MTALRLSFSSLRGIVRKRPLHSLRSSIRSAQNDKGFGFEAQPPAAEARKRVPQAAPEIPNEVDASTFVVKPLFCTLRCIPHSDCFSAPAAGFRTRETGSLSSVGAAGRCWASSTLVSTVVHAGSFWGQVGEVWPLAGDYRVYGFPVRCVQASARSCFSGIPGIGFGPGKHR